MSDAGHSASTVLAPIAPRELRPYQSEAVQAVEKVWFDPADTKHRLGIVLPTGAGKSTVIGTLASHAYHRGESVVLLAHRAELLDQMIRDLKACDPSIPDHEIGIVRAEIDQSDRRIVAATLQTLTQARRQHALGRRHVIIWDEVHHAAAKGWNDTFRAIGGYDADTKMCGVTATMSRNERRGLGLGDIIEEVVYEKDLRWAIDNGFLVQPHGLTIKVRELNALNEVRSVAGDFNQKDLAEIMEAANDTVVAKIAEHASDRRSIVFAASVDACYQLAELINENTPLRAKATVGATAYEDRKVIYDDFRNGRLDVLVTVMVLTEGADFPMCDAVILARPTRSKNLYSQMVGRALRLFPGKTDALIMDLTGAARKMRLVNLTQLDHGAPIQVQEEDGDVVDMVEEEKEELQVEVRVKVQREGAIDMVKFDLFGEDSDILWLETPKGVPFLTDRTWNKRVIFLWPYDGVPESPWWAVATVNTDTGAHSWINCREDGTWTSEHAYHTQEEAIRMAIDAARIGFKLELPYKTALWRVGNRAPSEAQVNYARTLEIPRCAEMSKARLSDEITLRMVGPMLDANMKDRAPVAEQGVA